MKHVFGFLLTLIISYGYSGSLNAQWVQTNGLSGGNVAALTVSGDDLFAATGDGVFRSTDDGGSWVAVDSGLSNAAVVCLAANGTRLFAGTYGDGIFLSTNNGATWTAADSGLTATAVISLDTSGSNLLAGADGQGVFLSTDNGTSWVQTVSSFAQVYAFATIGTNLFAATGNGVLLSADKGATWTSLNHSPNANTLLSFYSDLLAGTSSGVFESTNDGTSWVPLMSPGLTNSNVNVLVASGPNIFAGTDDGVFLLKDTVWTQTGLPNISARALVVKGANIFAGTYGHGVYRRPLSEMITSVKQAPADLPRRFVLYQNYPNPFNPGTAIGYDLPKRSQVKLIVYDVLGRQVETLVNSEKQPGHYEVTFDASRLPSGIYFYRLQAGTSIETKKLVVLK